MRDVSHGDHWVDGTRVSSMLSLLTAER